MIGYDTSVSKKWKGPVISEYYNTRLLVVLLVRKTDALHSSKQQKMRIMNQMNLVNGIALLKHGYIDLGNKSNKITSALPEEIIPYHIVS
jgi:hypothetical protein